MVMKKQTTSRQSRLRLISCNKFKHSKKIITICKIRLLDADSEIQKNNADLQNLKKQLSTPNNTDYASQSLANLQAQVEKLTNQQQDAQSALSAVNTQLAGQSSVSERPKLP